MIYDRDFQCSSPTHTHTRLMALFPGLPWWAGTRKEKPIWILLKQETVSGSGISWAICRSAPSSRQITTPAPHHSVFLQAGCPSCRLTNSVKALKATKHHPNTGKIFWSKVSRFRSYSEKGKRQMNMIDHVAFSADVDGNNWKYAHNKMGKCAHNSRITHASQKTDKTFGNWYNTMTLEQCMHSLLPAQYQL